jgi:hypothetical protein
MRIRAFLVLGTYYRRYIKGFAKVAGPLHELTKSDAAWIWDERRQQAFEQIRDALANDVVLAFPDFSKPFLVDCDASEEGMGAILSQIDGQNMERRS